MPDQAAHRQAMRIVLRSLLVLVGSVVVGQAAEVRPLLREVMGINGHFTFKPELYAQVCRLARNYHNLNWDVRRIGDAVTPPLCVNKVDWRRDVYAPWRKAGFETDICLQFGSFGAEAKGYQQMWADQGQWCFDYGKAVAAYFGPSGAQKLCTSIEIGNEPGATFDAALYKTIFTRMAQGIRAGDPQVKIATPTVQARAGDAYAQDLRGIYADPAVLPLYDIINLHTYATVPRVGDAGSPWTRSHPEMPGLSYLQVVDEAIAWRDTHARGKRIWITEFGYDACTEVAMRQRKDWFLKLDWQGVSDLQQAQYLVRSFMLFAERDVDRAYLYFYDDADAPSVHGSSGLTRRFAPKPSFWAVRQLYRMLGDFRFSRVVRKQVGQVYIYAFAHGSVAGSEIWVAWSPTGVRTDRKAEFTPHAATVVIDGLPAQPARVVGMATADGEAAPVACTSTGPRAVSLTVGESPVYLVFTPPAAH